MSQCALLSLILLSVFTDAMAATDAAFGAAAIDAQADAVQTFLFHQVMRYVAILSGAYGLFQCLLSHTLKPLLVFGGIALGVQLVNVFINGVLPARGMLIQ